MLRLWMLTTGLVVFALGAPSLPAQETELQYLSGKGKDDPVKWEFYCSGGQNSGRWTMIDVPSNWELQGFGMYNYGQDKTKSAECGKYRHAFELPGRWEGKTITWLDQWHWWLPFVPVRGRHGTWYWLRPIQRRCWYHEDKVELQWEYRRP